MIKKNKSAILEFDNSERRMKQLRNLLFPSTENEKQAVDEIGACFSDLASKLLEIPQNKRKEYFINITEQLQKIY